MVNLKLADYIKRHLQKGYSKEEIMKVLKKNKWNKTEISDAFKQISSNKRDPSAVTSKPAKPIGKAATNQAQLITLKRFITNARRKGVGDMQIKDALLAKNWPKDLVDQGFQGPKPVEEKVQEKPKKVKKPFDGKKFMWYVLSFFIVALVLSGTVFVFYYVLGLADYTITVGGEEVRGKCLDKDCSAMRESAFSFALDNIIFILILGAVASLIIILLYALLPVKNIILWTANILYFLFLVFIGVRWLMFTNSF